MKIYKRITALLLAVIMCLAYIPVHAHAEVASLEQLSSVNGSVELDGTSDKTVTVAISTPGDISIYAFVGNWTLAETEDTNYLTLIEIGSDKMTFSGDNSATVEDGAVWYVDDNFNTNFVANDRVLYATYKVAAETPAGDYTVKFVTDPDYGIIDADVNQLLDDFSFTVTVTVASSEPEVPEHTCGSATLTKTDEVPADCTNDGVKAYWTCSCGKFYADDAATVEIPDLAIWKTGDGKIPAGHTYGDLIPAQEAIHNETELKPAVAAHYHCSKCDKYFDVDKKEVEYNDLLGETPVHTEDPELTTTVTNPSASCTEEGKTITETFCSCGKLLSHTETTIPAGTGCVLGDPTYDWSDNYSSCTAEVKCQHGTVHKTETVNTTSKVTTEATCVTAKVVTYYADFTADWAKDQSLPVTGEKNPDVHYGDGKLGSYKDNGDGTHSFICGPCGQPTGETGSHDKAGYVYHPGNCKVPETVGCSKCPAVIEYSTNPDVHAANGTACVDNGDGATHTVKWPCCGAVINDAEPHNYVENEDHQFVCECEAKKIVDFTIDANGGVGEYRNSSIVGDTHGLQDLMDWVSEGDITREGYRLVGLTTVKDDPNTMIGEDGYTVPNEACTIYCYWESTHVCADNLTHVAAQDATCIATGTVEHWYCEDCDRYYSDDQATTEIDEDDTIVDIDLTNHAGEQYLGTASDPTLDLTHHGVYCDACDEIWDEENPNEPHVAGEDGYCVCGNFELCIDFSGGKITTTPPEGMSQEVWDSLVESMIGSYEATEWCMFSAGFSKMTIEDGMFVKDGYNYVGLAYDKDGTQPYNGEEITKPTTLYLIWESTHVCTHDHYKYIGSTTGHVSVCSCGEELGYSEDHELGENDLCVCGAWLFTVDYNGGKCSENPGKDSHEFYEEPGYVYNFAWNEEYCKEAYAKEGYVFAGYAYDAEGQNPVVNPTELSSTTTVYVVWACNHDETVHKYTYTDNRDGTHTVKCACGETLETTEPHDYTTGTSAHTCACEAVEKFTLSFDLNGGTLADEYVEFEAYVQDGKFILPDIEYGASIEYNRFYQEGWLVKEGYHITGFEDEDGNFHSLESDDVFTMTGATTLTVIWEVNEYTLTVNVLVTGDSVELTVPYGANLLEVLAAAAEDGKIPALGEKIRVNNADQNGEIIPYRYSYYVDDDEEPGWMDVDESFTMPAENFEIDQDYNEVGWYFDYDEDGNYLGAKYGTEEYWLGIGWHYIEEDYDDVEGGAWYYFAEGTGEWAGWFFRVEGLTRVPYPTEPINGWTYEADADALAYDPSFIDKDEAWFLFDEDGKFQYDTNGDIGWYEINDANELRYMNHGMLEWHPGLIKNGDDYYYFIGDVVNGGNIAAEGDTWITRGNDVEGFTEGHIYNFAEGKLSGADGIVDGKYYENSRLMAGNGLTKIQVEGETKFIYVRSNGYIVVNAEYYVPANDKGVVPGTYAFDENGYLINPELTGKDGIYFENGAWYYYENGKICYNKGLIEVTEIWHFGEGDQEITAVIYVRSNGQLATGYYYVTNVENYDGSIASGTKLLFGNDGTLVILNGIFGDYYYVNSQIAYGAGVVEIEEGKYIYVKSDGTVVMNRNYWITNVGDTGVVAKLYTFDENGYFTPEFVADQKDGIVDGYYYENGAIAYGKGLIEYNGGLIYVRSNGQVATGKYWITTTNGLKESGYYTFGEDGMMIN